MRVLAHVVGADIGSSNHRGGWLHCLSFLHHLLHRISMLLRIHEHTADSADGICSPLNLLLLQSHHVSADSSMLPARMRPFASTFTIMSWRLCTPGQPALSGLHMHAGAEATIGYLFQHADQSTCVPN